ncbi:MAG TPA: hypothetical protein VNE38_06865 [Ktedonobacteraceae bacterium]|nr:hypothetical protein [Ktedonobacteraceae bacterium]
MSKSELKLGPLHIRLPISIYGLGALGLIALGVGVRVALLAQGWPHTNSDEGTYGMMAINIAFHGAHPIFMYGQNYMGTIQAYMAAGLFRLFGVSMFNLRVGLVFLFALFLYSMYLLTSLLYSKGMALVTLLLLSLGSSYVIYRQVQSLGGWVETLFFGALLYFVASWLAITAAQEATAARRRLRLFAYFGWGVLVGLCLWSDVVVAPFILTSGLLLLIFCRRDIRSWAPVLLIVGLLICSSPMIIYNIHVPLRNNSLVTALGIFGGGTSHGIVYNLVHGSLGILLISLPAIASKSNICDTNQVLFLGGSGPGAVQCTLVQGAWSLVWIALWVSSAFLALRTILALPRKIEARAPEQQEELARSYARLGLLVAAALSLLLFAASISSTLYPFLSSRYIIFVWIATPALIYPLWLGASAANTANKRGKISTFFNVYAKRIVLVGIVLLFLVGTIKAFQEIPATQDLNAQQEDFVDNLVHIGAMHIYSDYWTCERVEFQSAGQITCFTVDNYLNTGFERYPPNKVIVTSDPKSSYAFQVGSPQAIAIAQRVAHSSKPYRRYVFDGYVVYQPA